MGFSVNQFRHVYVAKTAGTATPGAAAGTYEFCKTKDESAFYFKFVNALNEVVRTDVVKVKDVLYANAKKASKILLPCVDVTDIVAVKGQDYTIDIEYRGFLSDGVETSYHESATVRAESNTVSALVTKLVKELGANTKKTGIVAVEAVGSNVRIKATEPAWSLGLKTFRIPYFVVTLNTITKDGEEIQWGVTENVVESELGTESKVNNGKLIADLEYFSMGERGDNIRMYGFPRVVPTHYLVDPSKEYDVITIHFGESRSNEAVQVSERDMQIVIETGTSASTIITALKGAGVNVDDSSFSE